MSAFDHRMLVIAMFLTVMAGLGALVRAEPGRGRWGLLTGAGAATVAGILATCAP